MFTLYQLALLYTVLRSVGARALGGAFSGVVAVAIVAAAGLQHLRHLANLDTKVARGATLPVLEKVHLEIN